ncbi:MAG: class I SAM-dependent methyltransferase [Phycisphaeraceae bacterium]|nr:class I SAM-dependent methyltransferase [Phycisphaeraceae bacterium]
MTSTCGTLNCPCKEQSLEKAFSYDTPPEGEVAFDLGPKTTYKRQYDSCSICGHYFSRHNMDLSSLYEASYIDATYGSEDGLRKTFERIIALPPHKSDNTGRVAWVNEMARSYLAKTTQMHEPSLLDIGSGLGVFPHAMAKIGWDVLALDPDPRSKGHLEKVAKVNAVTGDFLTIDSSKLGTYDLVTLNKVLEHVPNPFAMLERVKEILNPNGILYVELPDIAAACDPLGKKREEFFVDHIHVFSPSSAIRLGERAGFTLIKIERIIEPSSKYTMRILFRIK